MRALTLPDIDPLRLVTSGRMDGVMERLARKFRCIGVAAAGLLACSAALSREAPSDSPNGIDSEEGFAALLNALAESEPQDRPALLSRAADLEQRELHSLTAHNPIAHFRAPAHPNTLGLESVDYGVAPRSLDPQQAICSLRLNFVAAGADPATCVQFSASRLALGMPADTEPPRVITAVPNQHFRQQDERRGERGNVVVGTDGGVAPCLRYVSIQFHAPSHPRLRFGFEPKALNAIMGKAAGDYLVYGRRLSDQVFMAIGIPDNHPAGQADRSMKLDRGYGLTYGCRQHSCPEKGAVISDASGSVVRAALISNKCSASGCQATSTLTVFKNPAQMGGEGDQEMLDEAIREWAKARVPEIEVDAVELQAAS